MITISFPHGIESNELLEFMRIQSGMIRASYAAAKNGKTEKEIRAVLKERYSDTCMDSWFQQSAIKKGIGDYKADVELGNETRIFGGKGNFIRRAEGKISNNEWKLKRLYLQVSLQKS